MKRRTQFNIPEDVCRQILLFLPVKSLLAFRSVSKSFRSMIDHPDFIASHLRTFPQNLNQTLTLFRRSVIPHNQPIDICEIRDRNNGFALCAVLKAPVSHYFTNSVDGLFLLNPHRLSDPDKLITLWNPCTRRIRSLTLPPISFNRSNFIDLCSIIGLAYDSSSGDYKVVFIMSMSGAWIYSVETGRWTSISVKDSGMCSQPGRCIIKKRPVFFEGSLVWFETFIDEFEGNRHRMVRFEVATLKFFYLYACLWPSTGKKRGFRYDDLLVKIDGGSTLGMHCGHEQCVWGLSMDGNVCLFNKSYQLPSCTITAPECLSESVSLWTIDNVGTLMPQIIRAGFHGIQLDDSSYVQSLIRL